MPDFQSKNLPEINRAFLEDERAVWVRNFRVACILASIFTIAGCSLDALIYPEHLSESVSYTHLKHPRSHGGAKRFGHGSRPV